MKIKEITFGSDTKFRKQYFVPESFQHPAKMNAHLLVYLVENFTKKGDVILDVMGGIGTILLATPLGRHCIMIELESKFVALANKNWQKIKGIGPMLGYKMGEALILRGDARDLEGLFADKILFSPPYEESLGGGSGVHPLKTSKGTTRGRGYSSFGESTCKEYAPSNDNIGNLKSENYLDAMLQVYVQCYGVLKDEGLLILVTKNFIRDKKLVRLDLDTIKLCEKSGFVLKERLKRKLTQQSFWRILYQRKYPDAPKIDFEDVLVFTKQ